MLDFKVIIVGDSSVGKSSMVEYLTMERFGRDLQPTIGVDFRQKCMEIDGHQIKLKIWDTAGQERYRCLTPSFYRGADVILFVYDVTNEESFLNTKNWIDEAETYATKPDFIKLLVGNKIDLPSPLITREMGLKYSIKNNLHFMESSALSGVGIKFMFEELASQVLSKPELWEDPQFAMSLTRNKKKKKCCFNL